MCGRAQQTNVTGTVVDPNGIPYAGATLKVSLTPTTNGQIFWTGGTQAQCVAAGAGSAPCKIPFTPPNAPIELDTTGSFSTSLYPNGQISPAGTQWQFQININSPGPLGPGPVTFSAQITIVGAYQSVQRDAQRDRAVTLRGGIRAGRNSGRAVGQFAVQQCGRVRGNREFQLYLSGPDEVAFADSIF